MRDIMGALYENEQGLSTDVITEAMETFADALLQSVAANRGARRVLIIPPDITRLHSGAGLLTRLLYARLNTAVRCDILPALGSHRPMSRDEQHSFFGDIPPEHFIVHDWRRDTVTLGEVPEEVMSSLSGGAMREAVPVEINRRVTEYDAVISIGQVVPHEVAGMANYTKNLLVGCGGSRMIDASHMLSVYADAVDAEGWIGRDHSPVRQLFDYAQTRYLDALPVHYILTVATGSSICESSTASETTPSDGIPFGASVLNGLYIGGGRAAFEKAVALSQRLNITHTGRPVETMVAYLSPDEFRSSWLANKAIYRTRRALAENARLIILAPGFERFGEDAVNDEIIRRYGYAGGKKLLEWIKTEKPLQNNRGAWAHLVLGSTDGRFSIIYCTPPEYREALQGVGYTWGDYQEYAARYAGLQAGWNNPEDNPVYFVHNPALGLWVV